MITLFLIQKFGVGNFCSSRLALQRDILAAWCTPPEKYFLFVVQNSKVLFINVNTHPKNEIIKFKKVTKLLSLVCRIYKKKQIFKGTIHGSIFKGKKLELKISAALAWLYSATFWLPGLLRQRNVCNFGAEFESLIPKTRNHRSRFSRSLYRK